jgi:acyl carrier protein
MKEQIIKLLEELHPETGFASVSEDFVKSGLLDSFDIVELISGLEEAFGISISALDLLPENFGSVESIEKLVGKYLATKKL